jgi:hypothetical protein
MPYDDTQYSETNVNYLNKDFTTLKGNLIEYAKTYFPNSYKDFNETSPGMMLIEMSAYVGDVLSFYIDQQYREMMLPLAEERRNVMNLAKMLGYKVKPTVPAFANITFTQTVDASTDGSEPDYSQAVVVATSQQVKSVTDSEILYETLSPIDFTISGSGTGFQEPTVSAIDANGLATSYDLKRTVKSISGETKSTNISVGTPKKFLKLTLEDTNVIDIISVVDSNSNDWYEVDYLAQDKIPIETHYKADADRDTAYQRISDDTSTQIPVPYTLTYKRTSKRFVVETNDDNTTSLVFGNGVLRHGGIQTSAFLQSQQVGITFPGNTENLIEAIDPQLGDEYSTLGETPAQTTLTITYRTGGGISANIPSGDLTDMQTITYLHGSDATITSTNEGPGVGGSNQESVDEIRQRAKAHFSTQNRCVTKEDYEARIMAIPAKFGNLAKVYVKRAAMFGDTMRGIIDTNDDKVINEADVDTYLEYGNTDYLISFAQSVLTTYPTLPEPGSEITLDFAELIDVLRDLVNVVDPMKAQSAKIGNALNTILSNDQNLPTIDIYTLSYNNKKELTGTPMDPIGINIKNYLNQYKLITDEVIIKSGYVINFGVLFDVYAHKWANKQEVKFKCIQKISDYFVIDKMQFRQPIYTSNLEYILMGIEGVRSVQYVCATQDENYKSEPIDADAFRPKLYSTSWDANSSTWVDHSSDTENFSANMGYKFNFQAAEVNGIIRPSVTPAVFELKNPELNIRGKVR